MAKKPFKDTKVGQFLQSKGFDQVIKVAGNIVPGADLITNIRDLVLGGQGEKVLTPEEKQEFESLVAQDMQEYQAYLADVQNARNREIQVNASESASWLAKNAGPLIALAYITFSMILYTLVLIGRIKTSDNITFQIITIVGSIVTFIVGYYFGSSRNSADKDKAIRNLTDSKL